MGRNYFNTFNKAFRTVVSDPIKSISHDVDNIGHFFVFPHTNESILPIPIIRKGGIVGGLGGGILGLTLPGSNQSHKDRAHSSTTEVFNKIKNVVEDLLKGVGEEEFSRLTGIPVASLRKILTFAGTQTDNMRALGDIANVLGAVIDFGGGSVLNPFTALTGEQLLQGGSGLTSAADLIDDANNAVHHWNNGEYHEVVAKMGNMAKSLKGIVGKEKAEELQLDKLSDRFSDVSGKMKIAQEKLSMVKEKLGLQGVEIESIKQEERENEKKNQERARAMEKSMELNQELEVHLEERNEAGQHEILNQLGGLKNIEEIQTSLQMENIQSSRTNNHLLNQIIEDNRGEHKAFQHQAIVLDKALQGLEDEEEKEVDSLNQIATTLDRPQNVDDFMRDIDNFDSEDAKVDYVSENYQSFVNFNQEDMNKILDKLNEL